MIPSHSYSYDRRCPLRFSYESLSGSSVPRSSASIAFFGRSLTGVSSENLNRRASPSMIAMRYGAVRRVEGEHPRLDLADREVAFGTREALAEETLGLLAVSFRHHDKALAEPKRGLDRVGQPRAVRVTFLAALQH